MKERILEAILTNQRLDFSAGVLKGLKIPNGRLLPPMGPVLNATFQQFPPDIDDDALTTRDVETLSLAARHALLGGRDVTTPGVPEWIRNCESGFATVQAADICAAIAAAAREFENAHAGGDPWRGDVPDPARHGLQIVGARIVGNLDLVNCRAPFSLRLVGCLIDGPVRISHADVLTIDLSGSAMRGLFATYVRCRSVRLRRMFSTSVVDFGGAQVDGVFDASDCVVVPQDEPPAGEAFIGDRGIFNCSLARIQNEMRLSRARIYGGLTMMGTVIDRSLFMTEAVIRSPLAALETLAYTLRKISAREGDGDEALPPNVRAHGEADDHLTSLLQSAALKASEGCRSDTGMPGQCPACRKKGVCRAVEYKWRVGIESLLRHAKLLDELPDGSDVRRRVVDSKLLKRLLGEHPDARISAWRAQGAEVRGSIYASGMRAGGGLRLKYLTVKGSLQFEGVRLRSPSAVWAGLKTMIAALTMADRKWFERVSIENSREAGDRDKAKPMSTANEQAERATSVGDIRLYAIDLRYGRIDGDVRFGLNNRRSVTRQEMAALASLPWAAGKAAARADKELFEHLEKRIAGSAADQSAPGTTDQRSDIAHDQRSRVIGGINVSGTQIGGELDLTGAVANMFAVTTDASSINPDVPTHFLDFSYSTIERGVDLAATIGVNGVCGEYSTLNGSIEFCKMEAREEDPPARRAVLLGGKILMVGAKVKGDALFLFDADAGPTLTLKRSSVGGRLYIVPRSGDLSCNVIEFAEFRARPTANEQREPAIDLRHVTAPVFMHARMAWPKKGQLLIEGFDYQRARSKGPLSSAERDKSATGRVQWQTPLFQPKEWRNAIAVAVGVVLSLLFITCFARQSIIALCEDLTAMLGFWNLILAGVWLSVVLALEFVRQKTKPTPHDAKPRGIAWLSLQRRRPNPHRSKGTIVPLQPYLQAARVLNAAGHYEAAHRIEVERLRERARIWSLRHNPGLKVVLWMADLFFKYGFAPMRAVTVAVATVLFGAMVFNSADMCAQMQPISDNVIAIAYADKDKKPNWPPPPPSVVGFGESVGPPYPKFISLLYALDVVVPIFDLGQEQYWGPSYRPMVREWSRLPHCAYVNNTHLYVLIYVVLKILGWIFATLIAVAVITRAETLVARNEE